MESLQSEDGSNFIRSLAQFIRQHEKALANSLQLSVHRKQPSLNASTTSLSSIASGTTPTSTTNTSTNSLAAAFSFTGLNFMSHSIKAAHLTLTPHHLFYLLSRVEELGITIGPMNVRLENLNSEPSPSNYVSFLQTRQIPSRSRGDGDSIHSVSSMRSVMSGMSAFWSSIGLGPSASKTEKAKAAVEADLKYLYSAFTKLPSLRLTADHRARLIRGYEEFPFDTAVPLFAFKNIQQLDIVDLDFRQFHGWDRLAEQLILLTVKRAHLDDPAELLTDVVLDDAEKRRRRTTKGRRGSPTPTASWTMPSTPRGEYAYTNSEPGSPAEGTPAEEEHTLSKDKIVFSGSVSPKHPSPVRPVSSYRHVRTYSTKMKRSGSASSNSSDYSYRQQRNDSVSNLLSMNVLPPSKWQRLKYLSLADNSLTHVTAKSLTPIAVTLRSFNLSSNLFSEIPDSLATLSRLTSLDLSNCMIDSLQSLSRCPLPAIITLKLKSNRLQSLAGIEKLLSLENLNVQDNMLTDPAEAARLTGMPNLRKVWVKHNPFTKHYSNYRITIFNLFRSTPGYLEDLIIDENGPSYAEKKLLIDRVPEVEIQPSQDSVHLVEIPSNVETPEPSEMPQERSDGIRSTNRRRKVPRRRIVDLAKDDGSTPYAEVLTSPQMSFEGNAMTRQSFEHIQPTPLVREKSQTERKVVPTNEQIVQDDLIKPRTTKKEGFPFPKTLAKPIDLGDSDSRDIEVLDDDMEMPGVTHDEYQAKVEALREKFGTNWLRVLGEQSWHNDHHVEVERANALARSSLHHPNNHVITSGGRLLG